MKRLRVASQNPGKLREFRDMLAPLGWEVVGMDDLDLDIVESGDSFAANAIIKARAVCEATGETTLADDSGLAVDALDGAPGVHSARYAGVSDNADAANRDKLLAALAGVDDRRARFVCALVWLSPGGEPLVFSGELAGRIGHEERGAGGFGYDPLFVPEGDTRTAAEMPAADKHAISHRGRALRQLLAHLNAAA